MIFEIKNDLTAMNCSAALELSIQLFKSPYSNNEIRMLYASAQGCNVGIQLYPLIDLVTTANFATPNDMFKTMVRLFPSRTALDSKLQSAWLMQDSLQSVLNPGAVIGSADQNVINAFNTGSVLSRDRTPDANSFLVFAAMAGVGTSLNRYGYVAADDPVALLYVPNPASTLFAAGTTWNTGAKIQADSVQAGCSLASSLYNMFDAISAVSSITSGGVSSAFKLIAQAQALIDLAGSAQCAAELYSASDCANAVQRLRYRGACLEQLPAAAWAGGVIQAVTNPATGWH